MEAVTHINGPLLVVAGAGSGKTSVLTSRIAYLMEQGVKPWEILAITFTNKAAAEMKKRVANIVGPVAAQIWLSTFHAFCARFLRMEVEVSGWYTRHFTIYDEGDIKLLVRQCLKELDLPERQFSIGSVIGTISNAKNQLIAPEKFSAQADNYYQQRVALVYELYQKKLQANNAMDFDDLMNVTVRLLEAYPAVLEKYQQRFRYILVDEYQDTNHTQYTLTRMLAARHRNLCVVGDADQSIYGWRGADISNILDFEKDYPEAAVIKLEQNYRSTQVILDAANALIDNNTGRKPKTMWTENSAGESLVLHVAGDQHEEARFVVEQVERLHTIQRQPYGGMAVLYRTNAQSRAIEEAFLKQGLPYTIVGGVKFYDRKEIKDMLAYLRVIQNPADSVSFRRIVNVPRRGIGDTSMGHLQVAADQAGLSLFEISKRLHTLTTIGAKAKGALVELGRLLEHLQEIAAKESVADLITRVMKESGYVTELEQEGTPEAQSRVENLQELLTVAREFITADEEEDSLEAFLNHVALVADIDTADLETDRVTLMTLHSAKGLEFPTVFLVGMEEGLFPHFRTLSSPEEMEEERRLCYVGITRAQRNVFLTRAQSRMIYGEVQVNRASRFLSEIPEALLESKQKRQKFRATTILDDRSVTNSYSATFSKPTPVKKPVSKPSLLRPVIQPQAPVAEKNGPIVQWKAGDKAMHGKWGIGTVVEVKGSGENQDVKIAFPEQGIKALSVKFAPIQRI
jgi:DNA helicase-2/ATP-dependent DNA helicase PcrA